MPDGTLRSRLSRMAERGELLNIGENRYLPRTPPSLPLMMRERRAQALQRMQHLQRVQRVQRVQRSTGSTRYGIALHPLQVRGVQRQVQRSLQC